MDLAQLLAQLHLDPQGLIPAIVQDAGSGDVLMMAYMNAEALERTFQTGQVHFWSRSRKALWRKGETSGHTQELEAIYLDCDADTLLVKVRQQGAACHLGYRSCFFRRVSPDGTLEQVAEPVFNPETVYNK